MFLIGTLFVSILAAYVILYALLFKLSAWLVQRTNLSWRSAWIVASILILLMIVSLFLERVYPGSPTTIAVELLSLVTFFILPLLVVKRSLQASMFRSVCIVLLALFFVVGAGSATKLLVRTYLVQAFQIPSSGMAPTLLVGDHLLANKYTYRFRAPSRGDLAVFTYPVDPSKDFLQRVIAIGGDTIEIRDKKVLINGKPYGSDPGIPVESNVLPPSESPRDNLPPLKIPENAFFVLGDNRDHSLDSRFWGLLGRQHIVGRPFLIYWSYDSVLKRVRTERIGKWIQ